MGDPLQTAPLPPSSRCSHPVLCCTGPGPSPLLSRLSKKRAGCGTPHAKQEENPKLWSCNPAHQQPIKSRALQEPALCYDRNKCIEIMVRQLCKFSQLDSKAHDCHVFFGVTLNIFPGGEQVCACVAIWLGAVRNDRNTGDTMLVSLTVTVTTVATARAAAASAAGRNRALLEEIYVLTCLVCQGISL